jgi:putative tricarboxylic transport membrane protein
VLGPRFEENFRRALLISRGDLMTFIDRPISAAFLAVCVLLIAGQIYVRLRGSTRTDMPISAGNLVMAKSTQQG